MHRLTAIRIENPRRLHTAVGFGVAQHLMPRVRMIHPAITQNRSLRIAQTEGAGHAIRPRRDLIHTAHITAGTKVRRIPVGRIASGAIQRWIPMQRLYRRQPYRIPAPSAYPECLRVGAHKSTLKRSRARAIIRNPPIRNRVAPNGACHRKSMSPCRNHRKSGYLPPSPTVRSIAPPPRPPSKAP